MPYNPGFPATYQPMYYQPQYQPQMPVMQQPMAQPIQQQAATQQQPMPQASGNTMIWIQGEAGAKSYMVAPNTTVPLWDSESQRIYLKSVDAAGMPFTSSVKRWKTSSKELMQSWKSLAVS